MLVGRMPRFPVLEAEGRDPTSVELSRIQSLPAEVDGSQLHWGRSGVGAEPGWPRVLPVLVEDAIGTPCHLLRILQGCTALEGHADLQLGLEALDKVVELLLEGHLGHLLH
jgi:hypothetical protein